MYTLYAPSLASRDSTSMQVSMSDLGNIDALMAIPQLSRFVPEVAKADPSLKIRGAENQNIPNFVTIQLTFENFTVDDVKTVHENIITWARRCRIPGVRGQRLAVISAPVCVSSQVRFTVMLGTTVYYNAHRLTLGVSVDNSQLLDDVSNLLAYVPCAPVVERVQEDGTVVQVTEPDIEVDDPSHYDPTTGVFDVSILDNDPVALLTDLRVAVALLNPQDAPEVFLDELDGVQKKLDALRATI